MYFLWVFSTPFLSPILWYLIGSCYSPVSSLQLRTDSGEAKVESHAFSETQPTQATLLLDTMPIQSGSHPHQCVRGNTVHLVTWSACTAPGPPQQSLVRDKTRTFLPAKPSLSRTMLGQLCTSPCASRSRPAAREPGLKPRISGGTAITAMHPGGP